MGKSVLVVDDSRIETHFLRSLIKKYGINADYTSDWSEAMTNIKSGYYDVVFVDQMMINYKWVELQKDFYDLIAYCNIVVVGDMNEFNKYQFNNDILENIKLLDKPVRFSKLNEIFGQMDDIPIVYTVMDRTSGIEICGSEEDYEVALSLFGEMGREKIQEIIDAYDEENWKEYTIRVHALKSSSRIIGANRLADLAEELEHAGKDENIELIKEKSGVLVEAYKNCVSNINRE